MAARTVADKAAAGVPVLGVCYGMQLLAHRLGGEVSPAHAREYGAATLSRSVFVGADVSGPVTCPGCFDSDVQGLIGPFQQVEHFPGYTGQWVGIGRITVVPAKFNPAINRDDIAFLQFITTREPVNHHLIDRDA